MIPPIMSISQLLSSDNNSERPAASAAAISPVHTDNTLPNSNESNSQRRNNGIQNLLNNDDNYEEKYEMADTDTDNEDHPTIYPAAASTTATATATTDAALDTHFDIKVTTLHAFFFLCLFHNSFAVTAKGDTKRR
jgi:DNA helicase INO80